MKTALEAILGPVTITTSARRLAFGGALPLVPGPAAVLVLEDGALAAADRRLAFAVVERLLGSPEPSLPPERGLSDLEWDLFEPVMAGLAGKSASRGSDPSIAAIPPGRRVDVAVHTVAWKNGQGVLVVCRPSATADRIEVTAGFRIEIDPAEIVPGAALPLGALELRTSTGAVHAAVPGSWRGRRAVRLL